MLCKIIKLNSNKTKTVPFEAKTLLKFNKAQNALIHCVNTKRMCMCTPNRVVRTLLEYLL